MYSHVAGQNARPALASRLMQCAVFWVPSLVRQTLLSSTLAPALHPASCILPWTLNPNLLNAPPTPVPTFPPALQELGEAKAAHDALAHAKRGLEQSKAELEAKVAAAAGALNAAEELKELRWAAVAWCMAVTWCMAVFTLCSHASWQEALKRCPHVLWGVEERVTPLHFSCTAARDRTEKSQGCRDCLWSIAHP